jgi:hypothetical protein
MTEATPTKKLIGLPPGLVHPSTRRTSHVYYEPPRRPGGRRKCGRNSARDRSSKAMPTLILKRASASRPSGEWSDDYDVLADAQEERVR